jgi:catechol 2,3-dioxygenase-like lactoylglutathione lyase family enzyme
MSQGLGDDWALNHVGMTVANRNATLRHFQTLGVGVSVGPQPLLPHEEGEGSLMFYRTLQGDPVTNTYRTGGAHTFTDGECQIGDCQLECYPMRPGTGMFLSEYLAEKGPGINHICFNAPDVEEDTQLLVSKGCDVMFNATVNGKTVENYLDSRRHGDLMISLRPPASEWENAWKANNEAHPLVNDWRFLGVGIAVANVAEAVDYYASLGFVVAGDPEVDESLGIRRQSVRVGPITFEFCEVLTENSICADAFRSRGEGVFDLRFEVSSLEAEKQRLKARDVNLYPNVEAGSSACFDTRAEGNMLLRLIQA